MALVHGHGALEAGLGRDVVDRVVNALEIGGAWSVAAVPISPAREPVLWVELVDGTRADFRLEQWELQT